MGSSAIHLVRGLCLSLLGLTLTLGGPLARADDRADAQMVVDRAELTLRNFMADPNLGWFRQHIGNARGVVIVPQLVKGGFIFGGSGGTGVLLGRRDGSWSQPAFYNMGSVSFGLQIGAEVAEVVLMVMTDRGMDAMYSPEFKLGADVSVAAGPVGAGAQAATADVLAFSRAKGAFGGLTVEGAVMGGRDGYNAAYYGRPLRTIEIVREGKASNPGTAALRTTLARGAGGRVSAAPAPAGDGHDLLTIQRALKAKGFDPGTPDGRIGPATRRAIRAYQASQGLPVDGVPSMELQRRLASN